MTSPYPPKPKNNASLFQLQKVFFFSIWSQFFIFHGYHSSYTGFIS
jgi:hypothetical protein